jgi:acid phosphatase
MKRLLLLLLTLLVCPGCHRAPSTQGEAPGGPAAPKIHWPLGHPVYDHVVIVVEENKDYEQMIPNAAAPYINQLKTEGASFTQMYGEEHHSEGNYFWLFSGSNQGVGFNDFVPGRPITAPNLAEELIGAKRSFAGYSEDLPAIGSPEHRQGLYARKHVPWVSFSNVPKSVSLRWQDFPADYSRLPTVSFVIPNLEHDMHNGKIPESIAAGDTWLRDHLDGYYQWAKKHNSLLIVTFDESDHGSTGLTDPAAPDPRNRNHIATIFAGDRIKPGDYAEGKGITHVNILRTLEAMYGLPRAGGQPPNARRAGILDDSILTDIFKLL